MATGGKKLNSAKPRMGDGAAWSLVDVNDSLAEEVREDGVSRSVLGPNELEHRRRALVAGLHRLVVPRGGKGGARAGQR